jgi:hypothetical protein
MAHQHPQSITIDDERYPGRVAEVVALDWAFTQIDRTTTLLLRGADGAFVVHMHTVPTGFDLIHAIDGGAALALYRRMHVHLVPAEVFGRFAA